MRRSAGAVPVRGDGPVEPVVEDLGPLVSEGAEVHPADRARGKGIPVLLMIEEVRRNAGVPDRSCVAAVLFGLGPPLPCFTAALSAPQRTSTSNVDPSDIGIDATTLALDRCALS